MGKITKTVREIGVKVRTLTDWKRINSSKYTKEQKKIALKYNFKNGHNVSATCRVLGFPKKQYVKNIGFIKIKNIKSLRN